MWDTRKEAARVHCIRDMNYHYTFLTEAMLTEDPDMFAEYMSWCRALFANLKLPEVMLPMTLDCMEKALPEAAARKTAPYFNKARKALSLPLAEDISFLNPGEPHAELAREYMALLLAGNRTDAVKRITESASAGIPAAEIYMYVFQPVQYEIGRLWMTRRISVAQEHFCTAVTQMAMSLLYPQIFATQRVGRKALACAVGSELHEIGIRMVADFFEMSGWDTYYIGANTPTRAVIEAIDTFQPDVAAFSLTMNFHRSVLMALIGAVRQHSGPDLKILTGGYPFLSDPDLYRKFGADGTATNARTAVALANQWMTAK